MTTETFIYVLATNLLTLLLSTVFYASRVNELRVEYTRQKAEINADYLMQRQVYGQVKMEDLLGREDS